MERLAEETDKVSVERLWKRFQRSGTIKSIESLLLSFFFFLSLFLSLQSQEVYPNGRLSVVSQPCVSLRTKRNNNLSYLLEEEKIFRAIIYRLILSVILFVLNRSDRQFLRLSQRLLVHFAVR